jgi:predicted secreted Zn-dependent protease
LSLRRLILLAPILLSACTTSTVTTGYYDIKGNTEKTLDRSIRQNSPQNGHAFAATELRLVPVSVLPAVDARGCRVATAKIKVVAHIILPRWSDRKGAAGDLKRGFDIYAGYARLHEKAHVTIGEAAAQALERELKAIPPQRDCDATLRKSKAVIRSVLSRHNRAQLAFDAAEKRRLAKLFREARKAG